jgi:hypothetical protein
VTADPAPAIGRVPADHALMDRVLQEIGARPDVPEPGAAEYVRDLVSRIVGRLARGIGLALDEFALGTVAQWLAGATLVLAVAAALWMLWRRRRRTGEEGPVAIAPGSWQPRAEQWDAERWRQELERQLAAGDARAALRALWWWMARALAAADARPNWTSQELIRHAGRGDLLPAAVAVDRFAYGPRAPEPADVASLYARISGALA